MKTNQKSAIFFIVLFFSGIFILTGVLNSQDTPKTSPPLPDNINTIVTTSCMPCHTTDGRQQAREKLNFTEWTKYSQDVQKSKAADIYSEVKNGKMPPDFVRENRPEIIPTKEQIQAIKKWVDSM